MSFVTSFRKFSRFSSRKADAGPRLGRSARRERGWALISVLWTTAMLGMMAAATQELTLTSVRAERRALTRAHLNDDLDAATVRAILALDDARANNRWRVDGVPYPVAYDGVNMTVSIQDEDGKFDLNDADADTLSPLFESVGVDLNTATVLADRIVEWRTDKTSDDAHTLHGGTDADYAAAGLPWRPRHNDFQSVSEVQLVLGMTPTLYEKIRPALTVYSRDDSPDEDLAPRLVLNALYPGNPGQVDKILAAHAGPLSQSDLNTDDSDDDSASGAYVTPDDDASGRSFEIDVAADYKGRHVVRRTVVLMTGDSTNPYLVQHWE
ncbi:MAG: general secretion pathway protein GspK [Rhizomicrobium sp.]